MQSDKFSEEIALSGAISLRQLSVIFWQSATLMHFIAGQNLLITLKLSSVIRLLPIEITEEE